MEVHVLEHYPYEYESRSIVVGMDGLEAVPDAANARLLVLQCRQLACKPSKSETVGAEEGQGSLGKLRRAR